MIVIKEDKAQKLAFWFLVVPAIAFMFAVLTQSVWRGDEMLAEMRSNCDKLNGVMIEVKKPLTGGSVWSCHTN